MKALNIRDMPAALMERLRANASEAGVTLRAYCLGILKRNSKGVPKTKGRGPRIPCGRKPFLEAGGGNALEKSSPSHSKRKKAKRVGSREARPATSKVSDAGLPRPASLTEQTVNTARTGQRKATVSTSADRQTVAPTPQPKRRVQVQPHCPRCHERLKAWGPLMMRCTICEQNYSREALSK